MQKKRDIYVVSVREHYRNAVDSRNVLVTSDIVYAVRIARAYADSCRKYPHDVSVSLDCFAEGSVRPDGITPPVLIIHVGAGNVHFRWNRHNSRELYIFEAKKLFGNPYVFIDEDGE